MIKKVPGRSAALVPLLTVMVTLMVSLVTLPGCSGDPSQPDSQETEAQLDASRKIVPSDWMGLLDNSTMISQLTIPGTHDSGTYTVPSILSVFEAGLVQTQTMSIADQLDAGIRFLDIRVRLNFNHLFICHDMFYMGTDFDFVIRECKKFLANHPSETILMSVKEDYPAEHSEKTIVEAFHEHYNNDTSLWYVGNSIPTLGEVRGKIVLLRRFSGSTLGIDLRMRESPYVFHKNPEQKLYFEDLYSPGGLLDNGLGDKKKAILENITHAQKNRSPNDLYLSFTSATQYKALYNPYFYAKDINPWLMGELSTNSGPMGVVPLDFVHSKLVTFFINSNFRNSGGYWIVSNQGGIHTYGDAAYHGHGVGGDNAAVALCVTPSGKGYWILSRNGGIHTYGDAAYHGHGVGGDNAAVALGVTPSGKGYWILSKNGGIHTYGDATYHGHGVGGDNEAVALGVTPTGKGYWILSRNGGIHTYGDAKYHGHGVGGDNAAVALGVTTTGKGYWILSQNGGIHTYGDATYHGHGVGGGNDAVALGVMPSGRGYWILTYSGKIFFYGDNRFWGEYHGNIAAVGLGVRQ